MSLSYDPDEYPDCPECETDVFVDRLNGKSDGAYHCHFCGWRNVK